MAPCTSFAPVLLPLIVKVLVPVTADVLMVPVQTNAPLPLFASSKVPAPVNLSVRFVESPAPTYTI